MTVQEAYVVCDLTSEPGWPYEVLVEGVQLDFRQQQGCVVCLEAVDLPRVAGGGHDISLLEYPRLAAEYLEHDLRFADRNRILEFAAHGGAVTLFRVRRASVPFSSSMMRMRSDAGAATGR